MCIRDGIHRFLVNDGRILSAIPLKQQLFLPQVKIQHLIKGLTNDCIQRGVHCSAFLLQINLMALKIGNVAQGSDDTSNDPIFSNSIALGQFPSIITPWLQTDTTLQVFQITLDKTLEWLHICLLYTSRCV